MLQRNLSITREKRASFGLFVNGKSMIVLFYLCFITIFLPQLTSAQQKSILINTEPDLKIVEGANYYDGTVILRLNKLDPNNCSPNLWFNIIKPDGTSTPLTVSSVDHCPPPPTNRLVKRHPECDGDGAYTVACCSVYPGLCKSPANGGDACSKTPKLKGCDKFCEKNPGKCAPEGTPPCEFNPYGPGCNVNCDATPKPPGCEKVPDCTKAPDTAGCKGSQVDCTLYPTHPNCTTCANSPNSPGCGCSNPYGKYCKNPPDCTQTPVPKGCGIPDCKANPKSAGCNGDYLDCNIYPRAPGCKPDCSSNTNLPGCNECDFNPNAVGCDVCAKAPDTPRCQLGYCDKNPGTKGCSLIAVDDVKTCTVSKEFILVIYPCLDSSGTCGNVINWEGNQVDTVTFEKSCSGGKVVENPNGKEFLYVCHKSESKEIFWAIFVIDIKGKTSVFETSTISNVETFTSDHTNIFVTDDGYCVVTTFSTAIFATFIPRSSDDVDIKTIKIYEDTTKTVTEVFIYVCNIAYQSSGYSCIIQTTSETKTIYSEIDFLRNGTSTMTVIDMTEVVNVRVIDSFIPLYFGGYVIITKERSTGSVDGYIIDNKGVIHSEWDLAKDNYVDEFALPNNTIVAIPASSSYNGNAASGNTVTIVTSDIFTTFSTVEGGNGKAPGGPGGYGSSKIVSTSPSKGALIPLSPNQQEFTIEYTVPVVVSTGSVSIFRSNGVLSQTISSNSESVSFNDKKVTFRTLSSTINEAGGYYVTVDNDFAKEQSDGQNVIGIRDHVWTFNAESPVGVFATGGESESAIIRLTNEGSNYYTSLTSKEKTVFVNSLNEELAAAIPCDINRISTTKKFQFDAHKSDQTIMRVDFKKASSDQVSSGQLVNDLNEKVTYKDSNSLATGDSTNYLDAKHGAPATEKLWKKYWGFLLAALLLLLLLTVLFLIAHFKCKEGRNFSAIFLSALIPIDLALDIAFITIHGRDFRWVLPSAIFFLIFPLFFNLLFTTNIIRKEKGKHRQEFNKWWKDNRGIANTFRVASYLDTDALQVLSSRVAGIETLSAPFTEEGDRAILVSSGVVVFLEDIPQFVIYTVYLNYYIKPAIVPILVLSSGVTVIVFKLFISLCSCCYGKKKGGSDAEMVNPPDTDSSSGDDSSLDENEKPSVVPIPYSPETNRDTDGPTHDRSQSEKEKDKPGNIPSDKEKDKPKDNIFGNIPSDKDKPKDDTPGNISSDKNKDKPKDKDGLFGIIPIPLGKNKDKSKDKEVEEKDKPKDDGNIPSDKDKDKPKDNVFGNIPSDKDKDKPKDKDSVLGIIPIPLGKSKDKSKDTSEEKDKPKDTSEEKDKPVEPTPISPIEEGEARETKAVPPSSDDNKDSGSKKGKGFSKIVDKLRRRSKDGKGKDTPVSDASGSSSTSYKIIDVIPGGTEEFNDVEKEIEKIGKDEETTIIRTKEDELSTATGAAISVAVAADGAEIRYIIITIIEEGKEEGEGKKVGSTIKITTTSSDNKKFITKTSEGKEYITTLIEGKYITKFEGEEYTTRSAGDGYITVAGGEEYVTSIMITIVKTIVEETNEETERQVKKHITKSATSGKGGYAIITTSSEEDELIEVTEEAEVVEVTTKTLTSTETDENGIVTITETTIVTDDKKVTTTVKTTKKDPSGKILDTDTQTTVEEIGERGVPSGSGSRGMDMTGSSGQVEETTNTTTDENGIVTIIVTRKVTDENGKITTTVTTTKKDSNGNELMTDVETYEESEVISREVGAIGASSDSKGKGVESVAKRPVRKQTKNFTTDDNGIVTITETEVVTGGDGKITTTVKTLKKDLSGKEIDSKTETSYGTATFVDEPEESVVTTKEILKGGPKKQTRSFSTSETDENGILIVTETTEVIDDGKKTTTIVTTKKDKSGKELGSDTKVEVTELGESGGGDGDEEIIIGGGSAVEQSTTSETDENGIVTETETKKETDENGKVTTTVTVTKKDPSGKVIESNTSVSSEEPSTTTKKKFNASSIVGPSIYQEYQKKKKK